MALLLLLSVGVGLAEAAAATVRGGTVVRFLLFSF